MVIPKKDYTDQNNQLFQAGVISRGTYIERQRQEAERQAQFGTCLLDCTEASVCLPCAKCCFGPEQTAKTKFAAVLQTGGFYGAITTLFSSGVVPGVAKSGAGLALGVTVTGVSSVIGTIWCCLANRDRCSSPNPDAPEQNESHTPAKPGPYIITTQPVGTSSLCSVPNTSLRNTTNNPYSTKQPQQLLSN